ncbi:hypothetical protein ACLOJK_015707 [Asimina triloba]
MARKKIREYDSKRLLKEHLKRLAGVDLQICSAQKMRFILALFSVLNLLKQKRWTIPIVYDWREAKGNLLILKNAFFPLESSVERADHVYGVTESTDFTELANKEPWLSSTQLVVKPDMLFGKRGKSGLVALNLDLAQVAQFVKERLGVEVEMGGCKAPITTFIVEPFVPHDQEFYLSILSDRLGCTISFSECGGIEIEENWDKVKTVFLPTEKPLTSEECAPLIATFPLETSASLKFTVLNPKGRIWTMVAGGGASVVYADTVGDLGYATELGNYAEYSGAPKEDEVLQYARVVLDVSTHFCCLIFSSIAVLGLLVDYAIFSFFLIMLLQCATANPDGRKRALLIGGGIANFTDVTATFNGIIRALREKESQLKASRMHIYVRRGGPNYQTGLAKMRNLGTELGVPLEVYGPEATMTGICKQAIDCIMAAA